MSKLDVHFIGAELAIHCHQVAMSERHRCVMLVTTMLHAALKDKDEKNTRHALQLFQILAGQCAQDAQFAESQFSASCELVKVSGLDVERMLKNEEQASDDGGTVHAESTAASSSEANGTVRSSETAESKVDP